MIKSFAGRMFVLLSLMIMTALQADAQQKQQKQQQRGKASYYSKRANGARTSSGERLNNDSLVCAHRTYPYGTKLLVRNPANGKQVVVRVIDRGPFGHGRVIDLSYEAARQLGMLSAGVAMVEVSEYEDLNIPFLPKAHPMPRLELEITEDDWNFAWQKVISKEHKKNNEGVHRR